MCDCAFSVFVKQLCGSNVMFLCIVLLNGTCNIFIQKHWCTTVKSTKFSVCFPGISQLHLIFLRWFQLTHTYIQVCYLHN